MSFLGYLGTWDLWLRRLTNLRRNVRYSSFCKHMIWNGGNIKATLHARGSRKLTDFDRIGAVERFVFYFWSPMGSQTWPNTVRHPSSQSPNSNNLDIAENKNVTWLKFDFFHGSTFVKSVLHKSSICAAHWKSASIQTLKPFAEVETLISNLARPT